MTCTCLPPESLLGCGQRDQALALYQASRDECEEHRMFSPDELERFRTFEKRTSTARKDHPCLFCEVPITKGTEYIRLAHLVDGDFSSDHFHVACWLREMGSAL